MLDVTDLVFSGPEGAVRVRNAVMLAEHLPWFLDWTFALAEPSAAAAVLQVEQADSRFRIVAGIGGAAPPEPADGVLAAAHLLADAVTRTYALHVAGALLVHAAAIALANGTVILAMGDSGAGKSTLAMLAAARGMTVLADDRLAVLPGLPARVQSLGLMPKLRLPLPPHLLAAAGDWISGATALTLPDGVVLHPPDAVWPPALTEAAIAGAVLLDRQPGISPSTSRISGRDRIHPWLTHATLAPGAAGAHLDRAATLAEAVPLWRLRYAEAVDALDELEGLVGA